MDTAKLAFLILTLGYGAGNVMVDPCLRNNSETCPQCPGGLANPPSCDICFDDRLDPHTNCTTCLPGNSNCQTGYFMLIITFHSYRNPTHHCGECLDPSQGPICCDTLDQFDNCSKSTCQLRLVASVEPFNLPVRDVFFPRVPPSFREDEVEEFPVGPFNNTEGRISNPFFVNMSVWTGRFQFYLVVYDSYIPMGRFAVDRFPLDISLGQEVPASMERKTYYGVYNIARFDLSFELTCSDGGSLPCGSATDVTLPTSDSIPPGVTGEILGGVVGAVLAMVLVSFLSLILAFLLCHQKRKKKRTAYLANESPDQAEEIEMKDNPVYDSHRNRLHGSDLDNENPDQADEIEMKDNPVYDSRRSGQHNFLPARNKQTSKLV